jgi:hypothetical protein
LAAHPRFLSSIFSGGAAAPSRPFSMSRCGILPQVSTVRVTAR